MGLPKGLDFAGGAVITLILKDFQKLTGRFIGVYDDNRKLFKDSNYKSDEDKPKYDPECDHEDRDKPEHDKCKPEHDKCKPESHGYKPPYVDVDVAVEDDREFLVLHLTEAAGAVTLTTATPITTNGIITGVDLGITYTGFPVDAFIAVNVDQILYAATGGTTTTWTYSLTL